MEKIKKRSAAVSSGHPDKVADQICDAVLDAYLAVDPQTELICDCEISSNEIILTGKVASSVQLDVLPAVRDVLKKVGYDRLESGFDWKSTQFIDALSRCRSGFSKNQGPVVATGYACIDTAELMPTPIMLAHKALRKYDIQREKGNLPKFGPVAKCEVTVEYDGGRPVSVSKVKFFAQHDSEIDRVNAWMTLMDNVLLPVFSIWCKDETPDFILNPDGFLFTSEPWSEPGRNGNQLAADNYGGLSWPGAGVFSGRHSGRIERTAAYAARFIAKHLVASGILKQCEVRLFYENKSEYPEIQIYTFGEPLVQSDRLLPELPKYFPNHLSVLIRDLELRLPNFKQTATYGHFGKSHLSWEKIDLYIMLFLFSFTKNPNNKTLYPVSIWKYNYQSPFSKQYKLTPQTSFTLYYISEDANSVIINSSVTTDEIKKHKSLQDAAYHQFKSMANAFPEIADCKYYRVMLVWQDSKTPIATIDGENKHN